jgi:predicted nucleotidyltransferase component of viral defense system
VLTRALVELFAHPSLASSLAFRGGTALNKLHLQPASRYSEDIDLVQLQPGPIGDTLSVLRQVLDPWLGRARQSTHEGRVNLQYRFPAEGTPDQTQRVKIEINTREHFTRFGIIQLPLILDSRWASGRVDIPTYTLEELLGTKLRALHQRKKGRDLFDLYEAHRRKTVDAGQVVDCLQAYLAADGRQISRAEFEQTLRAKLEEPTFLSDIRPLLRPDKPDRMQEAAEYVLDVLVPLLPGQPWKGSLAV